MSCPDMRFTKLSTKGVQKVCKLIVELFHQKQPNCKLDFLEIKAENENQKFSSQYLGRYRSEEITPIAEDQ